MPRTGRRRSGRLAVLPRGEVTAGAASVLPDRASAGIERGARPLTTSRLLGLIACFLFASLGLLASWRFNAAAALLRRGFSIMEFNIRFIQTEDGDISLAMLEEALRAVDPGYSL